MDGSDSQNLKKKKKKRVYEETHAKTHMSLSFSVNLLIDSLACDGPVASSNAAVVSCIKDLTAQ